MAAPAYPSPGDLVRIRDQRWRVTRCTPDDGTAVIEVVAADPERHDTRATFLVPFDRCDRLPFDNHPKLVSVRRWRHEARQHLAQAAPSWTSLRTAARAHFDLIPFQLEPALALTSGLSSRFLIADAVGLGKTIQAGLMLAETIERLPGCRVLVVTPAALREQWVDELRDRFGLAPHVLDAEHAARAAALLPDGVNPWTVASIIITSIDYIKRADVIRSVEALLWDLMVFDEAHALTGRSDRAAAAGALARRARAVVMLTATPHSGDEEAFRRLCAVGELADGSPLITFRRTREVLGAQSLRRSRVLRIQPTMDEVAMHRALADYVALAAMQSETPAAHLAMSVLQRRAASSAASLAASVERRISLLGDGLPAAGPQLQLPFAGDSDDAVSDAELWAPALRDRQEEIVRLEYVLSLATVAARRESKLFAIQRLLQRIDEPAIVFTQYRDTLTTIAAGLADASAELHGGMSLRERREAARRFTHGDARLLLATDAASEGLNLHHRCRLVINLEMPWTPVRLEQRIGRVDRIGQTRTVHAIHLIAATTSEEALAARVAERSVVANAIPHDGHAERSDAATDECRRLNKTRSIRRGNDFTVARSRPLIAVRARRTRSICCGYRVSFADGSGVLRWETLIGVGASVRPLDRHEAGRLLRTFAELPDVTARLAELLDAETKRFTLDMAPAIARFDQRERAIAVMLNDLRARLSASVLQRGLFNRRLERAASAQARMLEEADASCAARLMLLERLRDTRATDARAVFGIALR